MIKSSEEKELGITIESAYPRSTLVANAVRANLPSRIRSNTIACARGGKWKANQVMIDYLNSVRDKMPFHRFIQLCGGYEVLPHQKSMLELMEISTPVSLMSVLMSGRDYGKQFFAENF